MAPPLSGFLPTTLTISYKGTIGIASLILGLICTTSYLRWRKRVASYPPGPPPDPVLGNARQLVKIENQERAFAEWERTYGDVNYLSVFNKSILILNSFSAARDLLEKKGAIYSSRPTLVMLCEMMGWGDILVHLQGGPKFRKHRKIIQDRFSPRALEKYAALQRQEAYKALLDIGNAPDDILMHLKRFVCGVVLNITYGHKVESIADPLVVNGDKATSNTVNIGGPGSLLVDLIPMLKHWPTWMPFSDFKKHAVYTRALVDDLMNVPFNWVKSRMAAGTARQCIAADLLETMNNQTGPYRESETIDEEDIKRITGVLYGAATDTTGSTLTTFLLCMVNNPEAFKKAQEEIDRVIGNGRLIDYDDKDSLPYFAAMLKEVLRWGCPVPLGVPHRLIEEDNYRGYVVPEGTTILANSWAMTRNEAMYPSPNKFDPERFFGPERMASEACQQVEAVFGFGRRICPGRFFAEANIWMLMTNMIATMDIGKAVDEKGREIDAPVEYVGSFVRHAKPFKCKVEYRSEKARVLVEQANLLHN